MTSLQKLRLPHLIKYVSLLCTETKFRPSKSNLYVNGSYHILQHLRFCRTESVVNLRNGGNIGELANKSSVVRKEAQAALLEYLHCTRSLQIMDAENMSRNAPEFFDRLLKRVDIDCAKVRGSLARFLRYHPINEFEPFFESIGLKRNEYALFLPQKMMFLNDDKSLLENYYVLCNYGVARSRVGKIYKEAREVFQYECGVLQSKMQAYENLGLRQPLVVKIIASSPRLLIGNVNREFVEVLETLKKLEIEYDFLEEHISEGDSYDWKCMLELMCLLSELGLSEGQLGKILTHHPDLLLVCSGRITFCLFGLLIKFGLTLIDVQNVFLQFPQISVVKFSTNLCKCYKFLMEINTDVQDIGRIICSYTLLLGSSELKKVRSLLGALNCGKNRLREMVKNDPYVLKKFVRGVRVDRLPEENRALDVKLVKTKFLLSLGFVEDSNEMEKALKVYRGRGEELQERFDCLVDIGLSREEAISVVRVYPQTLNQSKDVIETKVGCFVKDLGYTMTDLLSYPAVVSYTMQRVKLRLLMYKWLKDKRAVHPKLSLSTLLSCSEKRFVKFYVNSLPRGIEICYCLFKLLIKMGRGRGKGKKQSAIAARDDNGSGEDEKLPVRRRGRPQKPLKDDIDEVDEIEKIDEEDVDEEDSKVLSKSTNENGRKRKKPSQVKENGDSAIEENGTKTNSTALIKSVGYRQNGSRRKNKPRRAAEVGVECK
ncbi:hypothetical protein BUALT_Bualt12G0007900 [Buddleja alternifolia]|uniref:Uncharacterized protein n=1 Tax=Buddleja alternifolia TaxID=168488 RepID=A0AAV6WSI7_9LAMI|nr:hypothetical protein BUALT_Bualt12G0007900 [Buddleja alternifolia]